MFVINKDPSWTEPPIVLQYMPQVRPWEFVNPVHSQPRHKVNDTQYADTYVYVLTVNLFVLTEIPFVFFSVGSERQTTYTGLSQDYTSRPRTYI
jgi:hypothetical protein